MRQWEQATWATGQTESEVIRRVGEIVARRALAMTRAGDQILILAGKGHNGDDARLAEPHLRDRKVALLNVVDPASSLTEFVPLAERRSKLIIDGLFGIGLNRALDAKWVRFIGQINNTPRSAVNLKMGDTVSFVKNEIVDWMYMDAGRMGGNYSAHAILKSARPEDREAFKRRFGLDYF